MNTYIPTYAVTYHIETNPKVAAFKGCLEIFADCGNKAEQLARQSLQQVAPPSAIVVEKVERKS